MDFTPEPLCYPRGRFWNKILGKMQRERCQGARGRENSGERREVYAAPIRWGTSTHPVWGNCYRSGQCPQLEPGSQSSPHLDNASAVSHLELLWPKEGEIKGS